MTSGGGDGFITFVVVMVSDVVGAVSLVVIESTRRVRSVRDEIGMNFELNVGS